MNTPLILLKRIAHRTSVSQKPSVTFEGKRILVFGLVFHLYEKPSSPYSYIICHF